MNNIVFNGVSSKGRKFVIRCVRLEDVEQLNRFINEASAERTFISFQGEQISLEEEQKYVTSNLKNISEHKSIQLVVECEGKIVGNSDITPLPRAENHIGVFGIIVLKDYRGEGIGKKLMEYVISEAINNMTDLRIITLGVLSNNSLVQELYRKFGFVEFGRLPQGFRYRETYVDHIHMYKEVKKD